MRNEEIDWKLLIRYLNGDASAAERLRIKEWKSTDSDHAELLSELEQIWDASTEKKEHWDSEKSWARYKAEYGFAGDDESSNSSEVKDTQITPSQTNKWQTWGVAVAVIFAIGLISIAVYRVQPKNIVTVSKKRYTTKIGQQTRLNFKDGTNVYLNAGSTLNVPRVFSDTLREVWLSGEAYFEVAHDPDRPFIVHTGRAYTRVLGTRFDVQAYPENSNIQVVVAQGLVSLTSADAKGSNFISKRQKGILAKDGSVKISAVSRLTSYTGWRKGKLVFNNEPFSQVVSRLKRWYNLDIKYAKALADRRLTARFTVHQPLSQVLDAIALTMDITYTQKDSTISFN